MKFLTADTALQLTEALLENDKVIQGDLNNQLVDIENKSHVHINQHILDSIDLTKIDFWNSKADKSDIPDTKGFVTEYYVATMIANAQLSGGNIDLSGYYNKNETYSKAEIDAALKNIDVDLTGYATEDFVIDKISGITGGSGGSSALTSDIKANIAVGGVKVNDVFEAGMTLDEIVTKLCVTYLKPSISLSISPSTTLYKKGGYVSNLELKASVTKNSENIEFVKFYNGSTLLSTVTENVKNGGEFKYTLDNDITTNTTVKAEASDGTSVVSATKSIKFVNPYYYGVSSSAVISDFSGLTELLQDKNNTTKAFTADNEYIVFAFDASYSDLTDIIDQNNFSNLSDFTKSTLKVNGESYKVYISKTPKTISNFKYTFK